MGNIYIGGTGKTPTTIKLYELLTKENLNVVTAKKFYNDQLDEQLLLKNKTKFISENNRVEIIKKATNYNIDLVIFDDGLQDKNINYDINFVCFDSENWIGNGQLIPAGPLREKLNSLAKYDAIFLKGDNFHDEKITHSIKKYNQKISIFYTNYKITNLDDFNLDDKYLIFSGIGNPKSFKDIILKNKLNIINEIIYPDHYKYTKFEIEKIKETAFKSNAKLITTEKDFVKIPNELRNNINYLKVDLIIKNQENLINFIKNKINE